jgi:hypothetical protein
MLPFLRSVFTPAKFTRRFTTNGSLHDITRVPIKLPRRRNTQIYAFLERFRIHLLIDPEKRNFYAEERLDSGERKAETKM